MTTNCGDGFWVGGWVGGWCGATRRSATRLGVDPPPYAAFICKTALSLNEFGTNRPDDGRFADVGPRNVAASRTW